MTVTAFVEFLNGTGSNHAAVSAPGRDILVNTRTDTTAKVFGQIKFTVDGLSFLSTDVKNKMNIASTVNLGAYASCPQEMISPLRLSSVPSMRWPVHIPRPAPSSIPSPGRRQR